MGLPDDVALMTSSHQGSDIEAMHALSSAFLEATYLGAEAVGPFMQTPTIFANDEFAALVFITLSGYYRQALACLRNAVEVVTHAAACACRNDEAGLARWLDGQTEPTFGRSCRTLHDTYPEPQDSDGYSIFGRKRDDAAWARRIYSRLCGYAHSRGGSTNVDLWQSNGPIRVPSVVVSVLEQLREVAAFVSLEILVAHPDFVMPSAIRALYFDPGDEWASAAQLTVPLLR
jgi:hypothetical protein